LGNPKPLQAGLRSKSSAFDFVATAHQNSKSGDSSVMGTGCQRRLPAGAAADAEVQASREVMGRPSHSSR